MDWRDHAKPIISRVIGEHRDRPVQEIRRALRDVYPFGLRQYHPYKVWCDEVRIQLAALENERNGNSDLPLFEGEHNANS